MSWPVMVGAYLAVGLGYVTVMSAVEEAPAMPEGALGCTMALCVAVWPLALFVDLCTAAHRLGKRLGR